MLERLAGELCDAVTGRGGSQAMLAGIERAGLFLVPPDARLVERNVENLLGRSEGATLRRWLSALPGQAVRDRPRLCLAQAGLSPQVAALLNPFGHVTHVLRKLGACWPPGAALPGGTGSPCLPQ